MAMEKVTGKFGAVYLLDRSAPVGVVDDPMNMVTALPGDSTVYPAGLYASVGDRTHKVFDRDTPVSVKNGANVVPTTNYIVHHQKGIVEFFSPVTPTGGANDVQTLAATGATAGSVTIVWQGKQIVIPWNATAAAAQALFDAAVGASNSLIGGGPLNTTALTITGAGSNASSFIAVATVYANNLTGATPTVVHTTSGTSGIKITGSYINTAIAANVNRVAAVRDWQFSLDEADVDGTDYDAGGFGDHPVGVANGTFQFERMNVDLGLYQMFRQGKKCLFAFYEDVRAPRLWVLQGRMRVFPMAAPVGGLVAGTIQGTLSGWPDYLTEQL